MASLTLRQVLRTVDGITGLPTGPGHEGRPGINAANIHLFGNLPTCIGVLLRDDVGAVQLQVALTLDAMIQTSLLGWRRGH